MNQLTALNPKKTSETGIQLCNKSKSIAVLTPVISILEGTIPTFKTLLQMKNRNGNVDRKNIGYIFFHFFIAYASVCLQVVIDPVLK
jgi:hypothetical protein